MHPNSMTRCVLGIWAVMVLSGAWGAQSANQALNRGSPSQGEIDKFCKAYPKRSKAEQLQFKPQYEQYCRARPGPVQPAVTPRIDRLAAPSCIEGGSTLEIRGDHLDTGGGLECRLSRRGRSVALNEVGRSANRYRFKVEAGLEGGKDYEMRCRLPQGPRLRESLTACRVARIEPRPEAPAGPVPQPELPRPDLVVALAPGLRLAPGQSLESVALDAINRGDAAAQGYGLAVFMSPDPDALREQPVAMLRGNRRHRLVAELPFGPALGPGDRRRQAIQGEVPQDLNLTGQFLCVRIDPLDRVAEADEGNNVTCRRVRTTRVAEGNTARPDLAGAFGSKAREVAGLPPTIRALSGEMGVLTIEGSMITAEAALLGPSVPVSWDFSAISDVDGVFIRATSDPISGCPLEGTAYAEGVSALTGAEGVTRTGARGSFSQRFEAPVYTPGEYFFQACGTSTVGTERQFTGHSSNVVTVSVRGVRSPGAAARAPVRIPTSDLIVTDLIKLGGENRGRLMILAVDRGPPAAWSAETFRYSLFVDGVWTVETGSMRPFGRGDDVGRGWMAITEHRLAENAWHDVWVRINPPGADGRTRERVETNYENNRYGKLVLFGHTDEPPPEGVFGIRELRKGPDWAVIAVRYTANSPPRVNVHVEKRGPGEPLTQIHCNPYGTRATIRRVTTRGGETAYVLPAAVNGSVAFKCILADSSGGGIYSDLFVISREDRSTFGGGFGYAKTWQRDGHGLPDLIPTRIVDVSELSSPSTGRGAVSVTVRVANRGSGLARASRLQVRSVDATEAEDPTYACFIRGREFQDQGHAPAPVLVPGETVRLTAALPCKYVLTSPSFFDLMVTVDSDDAVDEAEEENNTLRRGAATLIR